MNHPSELEFWGDCSNTYGEESKQLVYAREMGLRILDTPRSPCVIDGMQKSWVDFGGGPVSMLLKMQWATRRSVIDPILDHCPDWVVQRYIESGVSDCCEPCDEVSGAHIPADIGLCYNVLQHVDNPEQFVSNMRAMTKVQLVFEWVGIPPHEGHPQELSQEKLEDWFGAAGRVVQFHGESGCFGKAWVLRLTAERKAFLGC